MLLLLFSVDREALSLFSQRRSRDTFFLFPASTVLASDSFQCGAGQPVFWNRSFSEMLTNLRRVRRSSLPLPAFNPP